MVNLKVNLVHEGFTDRADAVEWMKDQVNAIAEQMGYINRGSMCSGMSSPPRRDAHHVSWQAEETSDAGT